MILYSERHFCQGECHLFRVWNVYPQTLRHCDPYARSLRFEFSNSGNFAEWYLKKQETDFLTQIRYAVNSAAQDGTTLCHIPYRSMAWNTGYSSRAGAVDGLLTDTWRSSFFRQEACKKPEQVSPKKKGEKEGKQGESSLRPRTPSLL